MSSTCSADAFRSLALGTAYFKGGDLVGAERAFLEVLRDDPKSGDAENTSPSSTC